MTVTRTADVLVIGLGPAGSAAAAAAASHGLRVIAIDRKKVIGESVQCAEFIPLPLARHAQGAGILLLDRAPAELEQTGLQRGIGRGKFAKPADKKSATSTAAATATVAFRSSKFYGNANAAKASLAGPAKDGSVIVQQATSSSIRSAKFFNSSSEGHVDTSDRTPAVAPTRAAAPATATKSLLADTLAEYFAKKGEAPPPMHTVDSETLGEVIDSGRLETTRKGSAPWTFSGIPRRGDFAIRLKRGSDRFIEFIPSNVSFGQTPRYYPRRVGVGTAQTYIPVEHLEYFDVDAHDWLPLKR